MHLGKLVKHLNGFKPINQTKDMKNHN